MVRTGGHLHYEIVSSTPEQVETSEDIRRLEERAFKAWPCVHSVAEGGWLLRFANGYTKRANSANAINPSAPFQHVQAATERFYEAKGLPAIFRMSPLAQPEADRLLEKSGYEICEPSMVMTAPVQDGPLDNRVRIEDFLSSAWREGVTRANGRTPDEHAGHAQILAMIEPKAAFVTLHDQGEAAGFGMAVAESQDVGLFDIAVSPEHRGRGIGRAVTNALIQWAAAHGAEQAYLQVVEMNERAVGLYRSMGFRNAYGYHYRIRP